MGMTSLSIVLTVFVLQLHHVGPHQKPVPQWLKKFTFRFLSRIFCMNSQVRSHYRSCQDPKRDETCLTTFVESDHMDHKNCNGRLTRHPYSLPGDRVDDTGDKVVTYDKISNQLKILVSQTDAEEELQLITTEWRLVAQIIDRMLFWLFFIGSFMSSISILVLKPMTKPAIQS